VQHTTQTEQAVQQTEKMKLIYVYDALCGWCYGFSPAIQAFYKKHAADMSIEVVSGGMVTGDRIGPIGEVAPYISWAYKDVEQRTGVKFGDHFLNHTLKDGKAIFSSVPPAIALSIFKTQRPSQSLDFAARLQKAVYFDGIEPENYAAYGALAQEFSLDSTDFVQKMQDSTYLNLAKADFAKAAQLGVTGFPTVFVQKNDKIGAIGRGFLPLEDLEKNYSLIKDKL
jgi:putative protein-disulfide isomerase